MNKFIFSALLLFSFAFVIISCGDDDEPETIDYDYHAHIRSPDTADKHVNDSIHLHIDFESHTGETVHHVNVKIYNKLDSTIVIYDKPGDANVEAIEGEFAFHDDFVLSNEEGVQAHSDWILEAKMWAVEDGEAEAVETIGFHVHPE